jgi:hypothetical protein
LAALIEQRTRITVDFVNDFEVARRQAAAFDHGPGNPIEAPTPQHLFPAADLSEHFLHQLAIRAWPGETQRSHSAVGSAGPEVKKGDG